MSSLGFQIGNYSFAAGELVYQSDVGFAHVAGISGKSVIIDPISRPRNFSTDPCLVRRDVAEVKAFADELATVDIQLSRWFLDTWRSGDTIDQARDKLRAAMALRS